VPGLHELVFAGQDLLPKIDRNVPAPPIKVAIVLPARSGAPAGNLRLVEHIYARNNPGEALHLKIAMPKDGSPTVDWGDGTPSTDVARDGKPVKDLNIKADAIGRVIFVGGNAKR
jgi:hypothetical protein